MWVGLLKNTATWRVFTLVRSAGGVTLTWMGTAYAMDRYITAVGAVKDEDDINLVLRSYF